MQNIQSTDTSDDLSASTMLGHYRSKINSIDYKIVDALRERFRSHPSEVGNELIVVDSIIEKETLDNITLVAERVGLDPKVTKTIFETIMNLANNSVDQKSIGYFNARLRWIDSSMISFFKERFDVTDAVGEFKKERGFAPLDPEREVSHLKDVSDRAGWIGLDPEIASTVIQTIMDLAKERYPNLIK